MDKENPEKPPNFPPEEQGFDLERRQIEVTLHRSTWDWLERKAEFLGTDAATLLVAHAGVTWARNRAFASGAVRDEIHADQDAAELDRIAAIKETVNEKQSVERLRAFRRSASFQGTR